MARFRSAACVGVVLLTLGACKTNSAPAVVDQQPRQLPSDLAPPSPAEGSPAVCSRLSGSEALTGLRGTIRAVAIEGAPAQVAAAASVLRDVAAELPSAQGAAGALERWAADPDDPAAVDVLAASFTALDQEVQARCRFPLS